MVSEKYLKEIFDPELPIVSSKLLSLSRLSETEAAKFREFWEQAPVERRMKLHEELITIAEDTPEADFDAIFRVALDDETPEARSKAIEGLWECRERWLLNRLITMALEDPAFSVRASAASALEKFVKLGVFEELHPALAEKVETALRGIIENTQEDPLVRARAIEALSPSIGPDVNDIIRAAYHSPEPHMKVSALYAMGQHSDEGWLPVLLTEIKNSDPVLRFEAAHACGELGDERAVPSLVELTKDEDEQVQEAAIEALGCIGGDTARRALRQYLAQPDVRLQEAARAALEELALNDDPLGFSPS